MAEIKTEKTADGYEFVYRVYFHPEVFNWIGFNDLVKNMVGQFEEHLSGELEDVKEESD